MKRTLAVFVFLFAVSITRIASAAECDNTYPWYFDATMTCDRTNTEGACNLSMPVRFSLVRWYDFAVPACVTVEWAFGDGSPNVNTDGATAVNHTFAAAGTYRVTATLRARGQTSTRAMNVSVANGTLRWNNAAVKEGETTSITVTRTNTNGAVQMPWHIRTAGGTPPADVAPTSGVVSFAPGVAVARFDITALNDSSYKGQRNYQLVGGTPTGGFLAPAPASFSIEDDDFPVLSFVSPVVRTVERDGIVEIAVRRTGDVNVAVSVGYQVYGSSTVVATSGTLTFAPGVTMRTFNVALRDDSQWTGDQNHSLELQYPTGGARFPSSSYFHYGSLIVTEDDPLPTVSMGDVTVVEGDSGRTRVQMVAELSQPMYASMAYSLVAGTATAGTDYVGSPFGTLFFSPGQTRATISFDVLGDTEVERDETIHVQFRRSGSVPLPLPEPATARILNDDAGLGPLNLLVAEGGTAFAYINIGSPAAAPSTVRLRSSDPAVAAVPEILIIPAGERNGEIPIRGLSAGVATIEVQLPAEAGGKLMTTVVRVYQAARLSFDPGAVKAVPGQSVPVRVRLDRAPAQPFDVPLLILNPNVAKAPAYMTIGTDGTATFTLNTVATGLTSLRATLPADYGSAVTVLDIEVVAAGELPSLASISPATGPAAGGSAFTATGSRLTADCTLSFGGSPATQLALASGGTLEGTTPPHAPGVVDVVLVCGSTRVVLPRAFTYIETPPSLSSITPTFGSTAGHTLVRATGSNFHGGCWMFFGNAAADQVTVDSTTSLTAATPPRDTPGLVATSVRCGSSSAVLPSSFAYSAAAEPAPSIISVVPLVGAPGESVIISGTRFRTGDRITFDGVAASILRTRNDEHVVRIPEHALGMAAITVTDREGRSTTTGPIFTIVEPSAPRIESVTPATVLPESEIVLHGRGFRPGYTFAVGGAPALTVSLAFNRVIVRLPASLEPGDHTIHVLNALGQIAAVGPAVNVREGALRLRAVAPPCGSADGGTSVILTGDGFVEGARVTFDGVEATDVIVVSPNEIRATAPTGHADDAAVRVELPNGDEAAVSNAFRYISPFDPHGCGRSRTRGVRR